MVINRLRTQVVLIIFTNSTSYDLVDFSRNLVLRKGSLAYFKSCHTLISVPIPIDPSLSRRKIMVKTVITPL